MAPVLFCPFCRESFEGETACPEHELGLVPWSELPKPARPDDEILVWWSPLLGRAELAAGALGTALAFMLWPLASTDGALRMSGSMLKLASHGSPKLWLILMAALAQLALLMRRRSPLSMRRARAAGLVVALVPLAAAFWAFRAAEAATAQLAAREGGEIVVHLDLGGYVLIACAVLSCIGVARLGGRAP